MTKKFFKTGIQPLLTGWDAPAGCFASDRIMVDGCPIGYMYREMPDDDTEFSRSDSGWGFSLAMKTMKTMNTWIIPIISTSII